MKKLRPSGGYRKTARFQTATIIYDATWWFCEKYLDSRSRTVDQMVQAALESQLVEGGGGSEQLPAARLAERGRRKAARDRADPPDPADHIPDCPACGKPMVLRIAKTDKNEGSQFWGCSAYPECKGTVPV